MDKRDEDATERHENKMLARKLNKGSLFSGDSWVAEDWSDWLDADWLEWLEDLLKFSEVSWRSGQ